MTDRPQPPENARWLTPYIVVSDIQKTLSLYKDALGFEVGVVLPGPDGTPQHAELMYKGKSVVMLAPEGAWGTTARAPSTTDVETPISLYLYCDEVDALFKQAVDAGMQGIMPPEDMFWGDRTCMVMDHDGYKWSLATNIGEFDESKIPTG